ncbi:VOC family protein [Granulicella sp. dw_53]|uniref:VOC family protein n=1 Tax=Granulicella sp. dw_53 TaxID=2719792 RepID=UPI001BD1BF38|nr:VOC family protein [Granulicella sp. dw_53]
MSAPTSPTLLFDHIGLVVADIDAARAHLTTTLQMDRWTHITHDAGLGVSVQFGLGENGTPCFELIAPLGEASPIARTLAQGRTILNHIAYRVDDLAAAAEHLRAQGCFPTGDPAPAQAYGRRNVQFFLSPLRFIIELIEAPGHRHLFQE